MTSSSDSRGRSTLDAGDGDGGFNRLKTSRLRFVLALVLLLVLATAVGVASGEQSEGGAPTSTSEPAVATPVRELPAQRTATTRTFELSDGKLETRVYEVPINYRDEDGQWQAIEEELAELSSGAVTNGENSFDVHLPEDLDQAPLRIDLEDGSWISQQPLGVATKPVDLEDAAATYDRAGSGAGYEFIGLPNGLKENITLAGPSAPSTYRYAIKASPGIGAELIEDGSLEFRDSEKALVAVLPPPFMADSAPNPRVSDAVKYSIESEGPGSWTLAVEADPAWLSDPDRVWPVQIDPTITIWRPTQNCLIVNDGYTSARCAPTWAYTVAKANHVSSGADQFGRTLVRFDMSTVPKAAWLTSATIGLYSSKTATNVTKVDMYDLNKAWPSPTWTLSGDVGGQNSWTTPGGDYGKYMPAPTSVSLAERGGSGKGWWKFSSPDLTWLAQRWLDGAIGNHGVILKLADETPHVCCFERRVEWESGSGENKPYLSVQYILPAPAGSKVTSPSDGTKSAKRFLLTSAWEESGVSGVTFQFKREGEYAWSDIPESQVIDGNNQTVNWPYSVDNPEDRESKPLYWDASSMTQGLAAKKFQIRVVFSGSPGAVGYTKPVATEINRHTGGPKAATTAVGPGTVDLLTGNFTISRSDVSIPAFNSALEFARSFSSREAGVEPDSVLGPGWRPAAPLEEAGGSSWTKLTLKSETESYEGESFTYKWAELTHAEGGEMAFEENESGQFVTPPEMSGYLLYRLNASEIALTDPDGNRTVFSNNGSGSEYLPISVAMTGGQGNKSRMIYQLVGGNRRLQKVIAPAAPGINCPDEGSSLVDGCRLLAFNYGQLSIDNSPTRLLSITYYASGHGGPWTVAQYSYDSKGRLSAAWDPRISPALKETYTYNATGQIATLTPPGQEPWTMEYGTLPGGTAVGRLTAVKRPTLVASNPTAQTTIAYEVPVSGSGAPYGMSGGAVAAWGQEDLPTDATAIFPPDEVPASPPSSYTRATVYYMDAEGQLSNVATESGAGTSAPSITTTETDEFGNVVRELGAQNRLRALAAGTEKSADRSRELDTQYRYSKDGTELQEEKGPMHQVRLASGTTTQARLHRSIQYDANFKYLNGTTTPSPGETKPHLPTSETTGALLAGGSVVDKRSTEYRYNWKLRKPTETITDPGGSEETKSVTVYDEATGLQTEVRQPKNAGGGSAGTTKFVYFKQSTSGGSGTCESNLYAGLPCKVEPAAQPGTAGQPQLIVKKFLNYDQLGQMEELTESPGGGDESVRKTLTTYDAAGRQKTLETIGGGVAIPKVETLYSGSLGVPTTQRIVCPSSEPGCDTQATTATYDSLGRMVSFLDADAVTATTTYDWLGRPLVTDDGKGTQTVKYDSVTGLPAELEDSAAGVFTASYDADGQLVKRGLPNGLTAETTFNEAGDPIGLTYTKASSCGTSCTWLDFDVERSIDGQILLEDGTLGKDEYAYDKLGRLITARETPSGGTCTTRTYKYDKDSNREEMTTTLGLGATCSSSGGTTRKYSYDSADRLLAEGLTYDSFGRITNLPAELAGGKALSTTYFSNDMVATQSQNGVTNTFQLDALLRQRQRLQGGGLEGVEVFHYAGPGDSPTWTQRGSTWTRSISGIGGELAATQESGKEVELKLTNLHGDVTATAALSPTATELKSTLRFDEFGNPTGGSAGRYGWLGGQQRRTELSSGVIQMGARSYVPSLGRFLTPDPIFGGSANPYDYANQDPINGLDLEGTCDSKKQCKAKRRRAASKVQSAADRIRARMREAREDRAKKARAFALPGAPGVNIPKLPWEKKAGKALNKIENSIADIFTEDCGKTAESFGYAAGTAGGAGALLLGGGPAAAAVGGLLIKLGGGAGITAGIFYGASELGIC